MLPDARGLRIVRYLRRFMALDKVTQSCLCGPGYAIVDQGATGRRLGHDLTTTDR